MTAGGAGGGTELVVRVEHQGGSAGDARGAGPGRALLRAEIPLGDIFADGFPGDGAARGMDHAGAVQFAEDGMDPAGAVNILDMIIG